MKEEIIKLEEELRLAMLTNDVDALDGLISDSLLFTAPNGIVATKQLDLSCHRAKLQKTSEMVPSEQIIEIYDDYAVVSVKMSIKGTFGADTIDGEYRYNRTWAKLNGNWQVIAGSVVKIV